MQVSSWAWKVFEIFLDGQFHGNLGHRCLTGSKIQSHLRTYFPINIETQIFIFIEFCIYETVTIAVFSQ